MKKEFVIAVMCLIMALGLFGFMLVDTQKDINLYENMVDASVLIYNNTDGFGCGVFIKDNVVLTAGHVINASVDYIEFSDGTVLPVDDFYIDDKEDIGFIFVDADELHISKISQLQNKLGDAVYLVGSPYSKDFKFTITKGILSHLGRDIWGEYDWHDLLQTDAEGAPGSSGSPLYNSNGEVIGIVVTGPNPGGGVTLCEDAKSILEAYERCVSKRINKQ